MRFFIFILFCFSGIAWATPNVVTSISPIGAITASLMQGIAAPVVLQPGQGDSHHYQLKPSDIMQLQKADLVIWVGPGMEHSFAKAIHQLDPKKVLTLVSQKGIHTLPYATKHASDDHGTIDPHIWLDLDNAKTMAGIIAERLMAIDSNHAEQYQTNLEVVSEELDRTKKSLARVLALPSLQQTHFYAYHNSLRYFENQFHLASGHGITDGSETPPSLYKITHIRDRMRADKAQCLLIEPDITKTQVHALIDQTNVKVVTVTIMPQSPELGIQSYIEMLEGIAQTLLACRDSVLN